MTQPQPNWITNLINRYRDERFQYERPEPMSFSPRREPFDPTSYYGDLSQLGRISKANTQLIQQRVLNEKIQRQQEEMRKLRELAQQQIDLSGITPKFTGATAGAPPAAARKGRYGRPLRNISVSSGYGHRRRPTRGASTFHQGVDLSAASGTPIYATHNGVVGNAGWSNGYGWNVTINGGGGIQSFYGHQSKLNVKTGQRVQRGQVIGYVGSTGISTGPHLHYGIKVNGQWVNPRGYY